MKNVRCDLCRMCKPIVDGKTKMGTWAYMCRTCFPRYGTGLGLGRGQILEVKKKTA